MTVLLRPAAPGDLPAVVEVFLACWRQSYRGLVPQETLDRMSEEDAEELWRAALADEGARVLVAEHEGIVVGVTRWTPADSTVQSLYVHPGHQGLGTGGALLRAAVADLAVGGARAALLWVFEANLPAQRFYDAHGWRPTGTVRTRRELDAPELSLELPLEPS
jgi:ribosomal protein S18 acetylase RimI-like enzyme